MEVTRTQNSAKNENGIFGISVSRGFRKTAFAMYLVEPKSTIFNAEKFFIAFGNSVHFPNAPPPELKTRLPKSWSWW